jgi:hypothetical protein
MRRTLIGACAGVAFFGVSLACIARPPEGRGKPADSGRPSFVSFPAPARSVGVIHSQQPVAFTPVAVPAAPQGNATAAAIGNVTFASSPIAAPTATTPAIASPAIAASPGPAALPANDKAPVKLSAVAIADAALSAEPKSDDGTRYSLEAVLPTPTVAFPSIAKQAPIPVCFAR